MFFCIDGLSCRRDNNRLLVSGYFSLCHYHQRQLLRQASKPPTSESTSEGVSDVENDVDAVSAQHRDRALLAPEAMRRG